MVFSINSNGKITPEEKFDFNAAAGLSVALGCFDGVHLGHRRLMERAAAKKELLPAVWTFSEPLSLPYIDSVPDRISLFGRCGMRLAICESFQLVRSMTPGEFVKHLIREINVKHIVCGEDFRYGEGRKGGRETLKADAERYGATVEIVPPVMTDAPTVNGEKRQKISSTLIRRLLTNGDIENANLLLGRAFSVNGEVLSGKRIGRTMKLPTVNQRLETGRVALRHGVYYTATEIDGKIYPSVTNIGMRPTVNGDESDITCETHVIGEDIDAYGKNVTVSFFRFAREERRFDSLDGLRTAVENDVKEAKRFFEEHRCY